MGHYWSTGSVSKALTGTSHLAKMYSISCDHIDLRNQGWLYGAWKILPGTIRGIHGATSMIRDRWNPRKIPSWLRMNAEHHGWFPFLVSTATSREGEMSFPQSWRALHWLFLILHLCMHPVISAPTWVCTNPGLLPPVGYLLLPWGQTLHLTSNFYCFHFITVHRFRLWMPTVDWHPPVPKSSAL